MPRLLRSSRPKRSSIPHIPFNGIQQERMESGRELTDIINRKNRKKKRDLKKLLQK